MQLGNILKSLPKSALLCASLLLFHLPSIAQDSTAAATTIIPDAQIEANVLKALAGAPQLSDQKIATTTVYGQVTLSGTVRDEPTRVLAETLTSRAVGVKKVVDELTLATDPAPAAQGTNPNLQSDGTMAQGTPAPDSAPGQPAPQATAPAPPPMYRRPYPAQPYSASPAPEPYGAQQAEQSVVIPNGSMLRVRINQGLDSKHAAAGTTFDGIVLNDVIADGAVAIPRGAAIQGVVTNSKPAAGLAGHAAIQLQLTNVVLAGKVYPVTTDQWTNVGPDKTGHTVGNTVGLSAMGAFIGAIAGGGAGAAIGAGAGAVAGLGTSTVSGNVQAVIPPEAILTFHLTQSAPVTTVSQAEMDRLSTGVPAGASQQRLVRRTPPNYYAYPLPAPAPYPY